MLTQRQIKINRIINDKYVDKDIKQYLKSII